MLSAILIYSRVSTLFIIYFANIINHLRIRYGNKTEVLKQTFSSGLTDMLEGIDWVCCLQLLCLNSVCTVCLLWCS